MVIPFGKAKGRRISQLDDGHLFWLTSREWLREPLQSAVLAEIERRRHLDDERRGNTSRSVRRLPAPDPQVVEEIVSFARRRLARWFHPDRPDGDLQRMKAIIAACDAIFRWAKDANAA